MTRREDFLFLLNQLFRWSGFVDVCIQVIFIFTIVRMFRKVFPVGIVSSQWCWWLVVLFAGSMITPVFLALSWMSVLPFSWNNVISILNALVSRAAPILLVLLFVRLFKYEKNLYRRLFVISLFLFIIIIGGFYIESYIYSFGEGIMGIFMGSVAHFGWKATIVLVELLFIGEVNRLQDYRTSREMV